MDLNQLLYHHQIALMNERCSPLSATNLVEHYARRLRRYRAEMGLGYTAFWDGEAGTHR